jgi:3-methyladenine DNA glycosylase AlkD
MADDAAGSADARGAALVSAVRTALHAAADPSRAPGMQAYMKSTQPYLGVRVPDVRRLTRAAARTHPPATATEAGAAAAALWRAAEFREERYAAQALVGLPVARGVLHLLPLLEEMITTGAWWDFVDEAAHRIGELLRADPATMTPVLREWSRSPDRWLRRTAVIAQLGFKEHTDVELLTDVVLTNAADPDFFLRKAIGWALRDHARTAPEWVADFVRAHPLSPLSRREATKHLQ